MPLSAKALATIRLVCTLNKDRRRLRRLIKAQRDLLNMTLALKTLLLHGRARLAATSASAQLDAEILLSHVLNSDRAHLYANPDRILSTAQAEAYGRLLEARSAGQPVAQLTGQREFWSLPLQITADVLSPRPETELLVETALLHIPLHDSCDALDLGTGSGAIAVAIATERSACRLAATDASVAALGVARANAARLCPDRIEFVTGSWFAPLAGRAFDVIVSNPPYVSIHHGALTDPELAFEPPQALYSGADGLDDIRVIVTAAPQYLRPGGCLLLEHGFDQAVAVVALLAQAGFADCQTVADLAGQPRVSFGRLPHAATATRNSAGN